MDALHPPIAWRQRPPWPDPPPGYRLEIYGSQSALQAQRIWGVRPLHIGMCTYALWVSDSPPGDSELRQVARAWLADGGAAASHVCRREHWPFGLGKICAYAADLGCPIPADYTHRARDLFDFLAAAAAMEEE